METSAKGASIKAGGKTYLFQFNTMLNDYQYLSDKFFKVRLSARDVQYTHLDPKLQKIAPTTSDKSPIDGFFNLDLLYSGSTFSVNHSHQWGANKRGGLLTLLGATGKGEIDTSALNDIIGKLSKEGTFATTKGALINAIKSGGKFTDGNFTTAQKQLINSEIQNQNFDKVDLSNAYEGSTPLSFTITTTLMTYEDPMRDVVFPCKILEYLSYPKTKASGGLLSILRDFGYSVQTPSDVPFKPEAWEKIRDGIFKVQSNQGAEKSGLNIQSRKGSPPPVWSVKFSNGLHSLDNCALTNVSVNYFGPWLEKPKELSDKDGLQRFFNIEGNGEQVTSQGKKGKTGKDFAQSIFASSDQMTAEEISKERDSAGRGGYPSYAEVSLTFTDNFSNPFGENVLASVFGGLDSIVSVDYANANGAS
jgi:hypothetical protein